MLLRAVVRHQHRRARRLPLVPHLLSLQVLVDHLDQVVAARHLAHQRQRRLGEQLDVRQLLWLAEVVAEVAQIQEDLEADRPPALDVFDLQEEVRCLCVVQRQHDVVVYG